MTYNVLVGLLLFITVSLLLSSSFSFSFSLTVGVPSRMRTTTTTATSSQLLMAGFGTSTPSSSSSTKQKKGGKKKKKKETGGSNQMEITKNRLLKKVNQIYGGTSPEQIAIGTEKRIEGMIKNTLSVEIQKALELRSICQQFDKRVSGMDFETIRAKYSNEQIEVALENRQLYEDHLQTNQLTNDDLQVAMQRITWDASADAKACKSITGSMPKTFQNRVVKASQYAYDVCSSGDDNDDNDNNNQKVLDVGVGYGVTIPFLKKVGFTSHQIHGIDVSTEMIQHAQTFYPDVATNGKLEVVDFLADKDEDKEDKEDDKYRAVLFLSSLHDLPDMKRALLKTKNELLDTTSSSNSSGSGSGSGSRIVIVHPQGASHVQNQNKQNPDLIPRGLPTTIELQEWLCGTNNDTTDTTTNDNMNNIDSDPNPEIKMKLIVEPAESKSEQEIREGYLAVLEII